MTKLRQAQTKGRSQKMAVSLTKLFLLQVALLGAISGAHSSLFGSAAGHRDNDANGGQSSSLMDGGRVAPTRAPSKRQISLRMPDIRPDHAEQYLCMTSRVRPNPSGEFIVGFNPVGEASRVHHMLMYGCELPGVYQRDSPNFVWDCSQMGSSSFAKRAGRQQPASTFEAGPVCQGKQEILYGWAMDAPALQLPPSVGFKIGGLDNKINFLVLQVHYGHYHAFAQLPDLTDNSGLVLDVKPNIESSGITRRAGVLLLISMGYVVAGRSSHEIWCQIEEDIELHPFRYRVHTHKLGTKVTGAKIGREQRNIFGYNFNEDTIIGVGDPQKPQTFYPVRDNNLTLARGDSVYASCEFNNNLSHPVRIGQTGDDEMCNFYMMYWTDSPNLLTESNCFGRNPEPTHYGLLSKFAPA